MTLVGIKRENYPEKQDIVIMVAHIKEFHGMLTLSEFRLAVDMAVTMQLDFNPVAYQNISVLYLNELLSSYKKWSAEAYKTLRPGGDRESERAEPDYSPYIYDRKSENTLRKEIQDGYINYRSGILLTFEYVPYEWWEQLMNDGYIEFDQDATVMENKRAAQLSTSEKLRLKNGQQMVWLLFQMAHQQGRDKLYIAD